MVLLQPAGRAAAVTTPSAPPRAASARPEARTAAIRALLAARAAAVLRKDKAAFLATVDPTAATFRRRQGALIDALHDVPLATWTYVLDPTRERAHTAALDARRGTWWAPNVTLRYALAGFDRSQTEQQQGLTFVQRGTRWYLAADDDFAASGHATARDLWDGGRVVAARGGSCLVLSHPDKALISRSLVGDCDAAVPRVTAVWGTAWAQRVVMMVPDSRAELSRMVPDAGDLSQIAAVATAELVEPATGYHPVGDRVIINPSAFLELGAVGRSVVLAHEITHVASRAATGPQVPTWLVEGLADYVGYQGIQMPLSVSAEELRADVRAGRLPRALPLDSDFDGARKDLAQTYEQSWLAVVLLAHTYGQSAMLRLYRDIGADPRSGALARAMTKDLHTTVPAFTGTWRSYLKRQLA
ncbi:MAG: hypothetical protein JWM02_1245 [Frankiales bacterium]|nr:hypothetical protein [Frankiales bacterium]